MTTSSHALRADGEKSFGQKLRDAVEKRSGRRQHEKQAEAERSRYRITQRHRTTGE